MFSFLPTGPLRRVFSVDRAEALCNDPAFPGQLAGQRDETLCLCGGKVRHFFRDRPDDRPSGRCGRHLDLPYSFGSAAARGPPGTGTRSLSKRGDPSGNGIQGRLRRPCRARVPVTSPSDRPRQRGAGCNATEMTHMATSRGPGSRPPLLVRPCKQIRQFACEATLSGTA